MTDFQAIKTKLLGPRYTADKVPRIDDCGVYAFFLSVPTALSGITVDASGLLYVGSSESSLDVRNHFTHEHSGFSTLRRTLGVILKKSLGLQAIRRGTSRSSTNVTNYRFSEMVNNN